EIEADPVHEGVVVALGVVAPADARLVGADGGDEAAVGKGARQLEDAVNEAAILDPVRKADLFVDDAVAVQDQAAPLGGCRHGGSFRAPLPQPSRRGKSAAAK